MRQVGELQPHWVVQVFLKFDAADFDRHSILPILFCITVRLKVTCVKRGNIVSRCDAKG
jgi:hypothetical protein